MFWQRQKLRRYQNENINKQLHRTKSIFSNKIGFTEISFLFVFNRLKFRVILSNMHLHNIKEQIKNIYYLSLCPDIDVLFFIINILLVDFHRVAIKNQL